MRSWPAGPGVAPVVDLAHANVPGSRQGTRWQDVEGLLAAGIDVISAVRIGQLVMRGYLFRPDASGG